MPWLILLGLVVVGVVVVSREAVAATLARLSESDKASQLGLDNTPLGRDRDRLLWVAQWEPQILLVLSAVAPGVHVTSGYRAPAVNTEVRGAGWDTATRRDDSRHTYGLALDFGGIGGHAAVIAAAKHLKDNAHHLGVTPRTVIAEVDHVHVDFYDPFGELDRSTAAVSTNWLREQPGRSPRFVGLFA